MFGGYVESQLHTHAQAGTLCVLVILSSDRKCLLQLFFSFFLFVIVLCEQLRVSNSPSES